MNTIKSEKGLGVIGIIILICIIIALIIGAISWIKSSYQEEQKTDIKANMLLIQGACKKIKQGSIINKTNDGFLGKKLSEYEEGTDKLIDEFKKLGVIEESDYDKYYVISDDNIKAMPLDVKNEKDSYYIVNYDSSEVIITKGYDGKYKLSEIEG